MVASLRWILYSFIGIIWVYKSYKVDLYPVIRKVWLPLWDDSSFIMNKIRALTIQKKNCGCLYEMNYLFIMSKIRVYKPYMVDLDHDETNKCICPYVMDSLYIIWKLGYINLIRLILKIENCGCHYELNSSENLGYL